MVPVLVFACTGIAAIAADSERCGNRIWPPTVKARNCRVAGAGVRRFAITRSSTVHALGEPSARAAWRRTPMQNGGALDDVRVSLAEGNFSFASARPREIRLGRVPP